MRLVCGPDRRQKMSSQARDQARGEIKAFTVLSLSKRKLNDIDDEEELFRSVLISNTMKNVRKEMWSLGKKSSKKSRDKMVVRVKKKLNVLGSHSQRRLKVIRRKVGRILKRKPKLKRQKGKEKLNQDL